MEEEILCHWQRKEWEQSQATTTKSMSAHSRAGVLTRFHSNRDYSRRSVAYIGESPVVFDGHVVHGDLRRVMGLKVTGATGVHDIYYHNMRSPLVHRGGSVAYNLTIAGAGRFRLYDSKYPQYYDAVYTNESGSGEIKFFARHAFTDKLLWSNQIPQGEHTKQFAHSPICGGLCFSATRYFPAPGHPQTTGQFHWSIFSHNGSKLMERMYPGLSGGTSSPSGSYGVTPNTPLPTTYTRVGDPVWTVRSSGYFYRTILSSGQYQSVQPYIAGHTPIHSGIIIQAGDGVFTYLTYNSGLQQGLFYVSMSGAKLCARITGGISNGCSYYENRGNPNLSLETSRVLSFPVNSSYDGKHAYFTEYEASDFSSGKVRRFTISGDADGSIEFGGEYPSGVTVDAGYVYVDVTEIATGRRNVRIYRKSDLSEVIGIPEMTHVRALRPAHSMHRHNWFPGRVRAALAERAESITVGGTPVTIKASRQYWIAQGANTYPW